MPIEVPKESKVYTKVYDNFKGVDLTNDPTNVWSHRSPSGVNMLPDASGRPFKRKGWEVVVDQAKFEEKLAEAGEVSSGFVIEKCYYFTLAGEDVLIIFGNLGVFSYKGGVLTYLDNDSDLVQSYDRAFFFEGNGKSALYVYGGQKVWCYDDSFTLARLDYDYDFDGSGVTIPRIIIGATADGTGQTYEGFNMLGNKVCMEYQNNLLCYAEISIGNVSVDEKTFADKITPTRGSTYTFNYNGSAWTYGGSVIDLKEYGISAKGTFTNSDTIEVYYCYGVVLSANVPSDKASEIIAKASTVTQFDTDVSFTLHPSPREDGVAWIEFTAEYKPLVDGEDAVRVIFPSTQVTITPYEDEVITGTATLVRGESNG